MKNSLDSGCWAVTKEVKQLDLDNLSILIEKMNSLVEEAKLTLQAINNEKARLRKEKTDPESRLHLFEGGNNGVNSMDSGQLSVPVRSPCVLVYEKRRIL